MSKKESFPVEVANPDELIWEGEAQSVSAENSAGKFDVLPQHANFVTIINPESPITVRTAEEDPHVFSYKDAVLSVKAGKVAIYVNI